jgi:hypothetical protein
LQDALALTALYASASDPKFDKGAVSWLARFALEADRVTLADMEVRRCCRSCWVFCETLGVRAKDEPRARRIPAHPARIV